MSAFRPSVWLLPLLLFGLMGCLWAKDEPASPDSLVPVWTPSYKLYGQPHAIWLSEDDRVGTNLPVLNQALAAAKEQNKRPEIVIYGIPERDMGQSSAGGFKSEADYLADNRLNASAIRAFVMETGMAPRVYLEPDALAHAIQYRRDTGDAPGAQALYRQRIRLMNTLIDLYHGAGALVYLDVAHSDWFDYGESDIEAMASALNAAGMAKADGLVTNVSNRQPISGAGRTESHYLGRLLPRLDHASPDVISDTSRNGGATRQRHYDLRPDGILADNEFIEGRVVGRWERDEKGELWVLPFFGKKMPVSILTAKDKYTFNPRAMRLAAPPWLDAVGDVQPGFPPSDAPGVLPITRFRYIKPPDDCDGSLNCPPGRSKSRINAETLKRQPRPATS